MKKILIFCLALLLCQMAAAQTKIGFLDLNYVLNKLPRYKQIQKELADFQKQGQEEFKIKQEDFQKKLEAYQQEAPSLSPVMRAGEEKKLQNLQDELVNFETSFRARIQNKEAQLMAPIYEKIEKSIEEITKAEAYEFIVRREAFYTVIEANNISDKVAAKVQTMN